MLLNFLILESGLESESILFLVILIFSSLTIALPFSIELKGIVFLKDKDSIGFIAGTIIKKILPRGLIVTF